MFYLSAQSSTSQDPLKQLTQSQLHNELMTTLISLNNQNNEKQNLINEQLGALTEASESIASLWSLSELRLQILIGLSASFESYKSATSKELSNITVRYKAEQLKAKLYGIGVPVALALGVTAGILIDQNWSKILALIQSLFK
jgi:hypothetical protein